MAGFKEVIVDKLEMDLMIPGGAEKAINMAYATPIGPKLLSLSKGKQDAFKNVLMKELSAIGGTMNYMGPMVTYFLSARKS